VQKISVDNGGDARVPRVIEENSTYDDTVDAASGLAVIRLSAQVHRALGDGSANPRKSSWQVVAASEEGRVVLRDSSGALLGEDGVRELHDHYRALGRPEPFLQHTPASPLVVGARVPEFEDAVRQRFMRDDPDAEGHVVDAEVRVRELDARRREATLTWRAHLAGRQYGFAFDGTVDGTMRIRSDGRLTHVGFVGRARGESASGARMSLEQTEIHDYTYDDPR
jgi:hypothetical protein